MMHSGKSPATDSVLSSKAGHPSAKTAAILKKKLAKASRLYAKGDHAAGLPIFLEIWDELPNDLNVLTLVATGLARLGLREQAIKVVYRALSENAPTPDLLAVMFDLAAQLELHDVAVKVSRALIAQQPENPSAYVGLMNILLLQEKHHEVIKIGEAILPVFPSEAELWGLVAGAVKTEHGLEKSITFYEAALELSPDNVEIMNNYGQAIAMHDPERAEAFFRRAYDLQPNAMEPSMGLSFLLFGKGELQEAHEHYAVRHNSRRSVGHHTLWSHKLPEWQGEDINGKTLLVNAEQGIGDEILFSLVIDEIIAAGAKLVLSCDERLITVFQRQYPDALVIPYVDQMKQGYMIRHLPKLHQAIEDDGLVVDYAIPVGSANRYFWKTPADIPGPVGGWLTPDPKRVDAFKARLDALGSGLKVGICWQSLVQRQGRSMHYFTVDEYAAFAGLEGIHFINMQYGNVADDIARAKADYGLDIHQFEDVDLKDDIEANLAIAAGLDLVIGPGVAPLMFAASVGTRVWWANAKKMWWRFGQEDGGAPMSPKARLFTKNPGEDQWDLLMHDIRDALIDLVNQNSAQTRP